MSTPDSVPDSELDSQFWSPEIDTLLHFDEELIRQVDQLPKRRDITLELFDYDGTLTNDRRRYDILPILEQHRWKDAYRIIREALGTDKDPTGFSTMIEKLHEWDFIFSNVDDFYDRSNPLHHILSAWDLEFQNGKITRSFWEKAKRSVVLNAEDKANEMLRIIIALGYVPNIVFRDDRIWFFKEKRIDRRLQNILGTNVEFLWATADYENNCVILEQKTQWAVVRVLAEV